MTSPVTRNACRAVSSANVPFANRQTYGTPRYTASACSSSRCSGPAFVKERLFQISANMVLASSIGGKKGRVTRILVFDSKGLFAGIFVVLATWHIYWTTISHEKLSSTSKKALNCSR